MGLSLDVAAFILIFQYISFEKSVNGFHINLPNLYDQQQITINYQQ